MSIPQSFISNSCQYNNNYYEEEIFYHINTIDIRIMDPVVGSNCIVNIANNQWNDKMDLVVAHLAQ